MNPASQEYYHTYEILKDELNTYKVRQEELKSYISKLLEENKRLYSELKENVRKQEQQSSENGFGNLEKELEAALAAKNAALEMWQLALQQLEEQEQLLAGKRSLVEAESSEIGKLIEKKQEEYVRGLNILSSEVTNYRTELSITQQELRAKTDDLEKCRGDLVAVSKEAQETKIALNETVRVKEGLEEKVKSLQTLLSETESFLKVTKEEMATLKTKNGELSSLVGELKEQNRNLRSEISVFEKDAKESLLTAQEAVLRRKEMAYREEQYLKEIEHLKSAVAIEAEKIGFRHKAEIKKIQKESSDKVRTLMEEIQSLHQENSDKQSLFERATREKQALESKLEVLYSECSSNNPASGGVSDELCRRLTTAEKTRDEFGFKVRSLETQLQELRSGKEQELQCAKEEHISLRTRLQKVTEDFGKSSCDRLKLSEEVTKLKRVIYNLEKELKLTKAKDEQELSLVKEEARQAQLLLTQQLRVNEDRYKKACGELQRLLDAELGISGKWKDEVEDLIDKSEAKIRELCQTIVQLQSQNKELRGRFAQDNIYTSNYGANKLVALSSDIDS